MTATYAELTRCDPNPVKRWLQAQRLLDAARLVRERDLGAVVDYGGGDGVLAVELLRSGRTRQVKCFEPAPSLYAQAQALLAGVEGANLVASASELPSDWAKTAFCLEVFEHLPPAETEAALAQLHRVLAPGGLLVIGVPVEIGPPALLKGLFRMARRPDAFDGRLSAILAATVGRPPVERERAAIGPGLAYFPHHLGFDHRRLLKQVAARFEVLRQVGSPLGGPAAFNTELNILVRKRDLTTLREAA
ncbi:hypothetical protein BH10PSE3_BH10PSE3_12750 [soil metagenome]